MTLASALGLSGLAATLALGLYVRRRYVVVYVSGSSMLPTLQSGDRVLVRRVSGTALRSGDLAVVEPLRSSDVPPVPRWIIKRVAAVPGDPEPSFLPSWSRRPDGIVPAGRIALLGDNAAASADSRRMGLFPADQILGVVVRKVRQAS